MNIKSMLMLQELTDSHTNGNANQSYMEEGVALLELASQAEELFRVQPASEKRRLLDFVCQNSSWGGGKLEVVFRQPFDIIVRWSKTPRTKRGRRGVCRRPLYC